MRFRNVGWVLALPLLAAAPAQAGDKQVDCDKPGQTGAGGILILLQAKLFASNDRWWLALALFAATATLSMYGQIAVVDDASEGKLPGKKPRVVRALALASLGAAAGAAVATLPF